MTVYVLTYESIHALGGMRIDNVFASLASAEAEKAQLIETFKDDTSFYASITEMGVLP